MTSYDDPPVTSPITVEPVAAAPGADVLDSGRRRVRRRRFPGLGGMGGLGVRQGPSRWLTAWLAVGLVVAGLAGFLAWLGIGLLGASRDIKLSADTGQQQLQQFKDATSKGNKPLARNALAAADKNLAHARLRARDPQVRVAGHLPILSTPVRDLDHLLNAATIVASAGHTGLDLYSSLAGGGSASIYHDGQFDIPALRSLSSSASAIDTQMAVAEGELVQVRGTGLGEHGVLAAKAKGLDQVRSLRKQVTDALPVLTLLPDAVGASGPKTYLVTVLNPSELRASGGAPLSVAVLRFDNGTMTNLKMGQTSDLTTIGGVVNAPVAWTKVANDPFWIPMRDNPAQSRFVNANANPDFRVAGPSMARAWAAQFPELARSIDGVIALDTTAVAEVLRASGPIPADGYGEVTADNIETLLLKDAYTSLAGERHTLNNSLMTGFLSRVQSGSSLIANARGLAKAAPGRHVQLWFSDRGLTRLLAAKHYDGSITAPAHGDLVGVFSQNGNAAKTDIYQQRAVDDRVVLAADGSAVVTRTVTVSNALSDPTPLQVSSEAGVQSGWVSPAVIALLPKGSVITRPPAGVGQQGVDQAGRPFYRSIIKVAPGKSATWVLQFRVPRFAALTGSTLTFDVVGEPQPMAKTATMTVSVTAPEGWKVTAATGDGASVSAGKAVVDTPLDRRHTASVTVTAS